MYWLASGLLSFLSQCLFLPLICDILLSSTVYVDWVDKSDHWEPPLAFHQLQLGLSATQVVNWLNQLFQMADNKLSTWLLLSPTFHIGTRRSSGPRRSPSEGRKSFTTSERTKVDLAFVKVKKSFSFSQNIILVLKFWLSNRTEQYAYWFFSQKYHFGPRYRYILTCFRNLNL